MCLVQTPYHYPCGHYTHKTIVPHGRCARALHSPSACWEPIDGGVKTLYTLCASCEREAVEVLDSGGLSTTIGQGMQSGPVNVARFNQLVRLHRQTHEGERRASLASISSSTPSDLAIRRESDASVSSTLSGSRVLVTETVVYQPVVAVQPVSIAPRIRDFGAVRAGTDGGGSDGGGVGGGHQGKKEGNEFGQGISKDPS